MKLMVPQHTEYSVSRVKAFAIRRGIHPRSALLLAGIGVTHEFVPKPDEKPGHYGENPAWRNAAGNVVPATRRERSSRKRDYDLI